ncbi:protein FAM189A1 isoform X2 [Protopterus annectens]|nr:protein FAM189A1 isoform X2 [Protopterus annectens]
MPHRSRSINPDCMTPHGTILHQTLDFDEFIPPIPPPPYYPPEYTSTPGIDGQRGFHLDFPHSPFSALYGIAINSPGVPYTAELPPPYEVVVGQTSASQVTNLDQQVMDSSMGERNTTTGFSTQASFDSTSMMVSEAADIPDHSCSSQDLCSVEVQGSLQSTNMSPYSTILTAATDGSCSSLERIVQCGLNQSSSQCSVEEDGGFCREFVDRSQTKDSRNCTQDKSPDCSAQEFRFLERVPLEPVKKQKNTPAFKQMKMCCGVFSQPSSQLYSATNTAHANSSPHSSCMERARLHYRHGKYRISKIVRSTSDPVSCSIPEGDAGTYSLTCKQQHVSDLSQTTFVTASYCNSCSAASLSQDTVTNFHSCGRRKEGGKRDLWLKPRALYAISKEWPHSLVDLKTYKDTKVLVAKFLQHSNCNLPPEVQHVVNTIKSVIKSDERHMEEAIFSANVIDQVIMSSCQNTRTPRKRLEEDLHLQSCGALSSPSSLRRAQLGCKLKKGRSHSLVGVSRETVL